MEQNYEFFIKTNLDKYIGQWVAIRDNKIVAYGKEPKKIFKEAKEKYPIKK